MIIITIKILYFVKIHCAVDFIATPKCFLEIFKMRQNWIIQNIEDLQFLLLDKN